MLFKFAIVLPDTPLQGAIEVAYLVAAILLTIGWVMNIIALINAPQLIQWGALEVLRVVGIFLAPLGGVLGWF